MLVVKTRSDFFFFWENTVKSIVKGHSVKAQVSTADTYFLNHFALSNFPPYCERLWLNSFLIFSIFIASFFNNRISLNSNKMVIQASRLLRWSGQFSRCLDYNRSSHMQLSEFPSSYNDESLTLEPNWSVIQHAAKWKFDNALKCLSNICFQFPLSFLPIKKGTLVVRILVPLYFHNTWE